MKRWHLPRISSATLWIAAAACAAAAVLIAGLVRSAPQPASVDNHLLHLTLNEHGDAYDYALYVPPGLKPDAAAPLVVVMHGCTMTADQMAAASDYDTLAAREHFIVLYPDVDTVDATHDRCWKGIYAPDTEGRARGDGAAIVDMTGAVMKRWRVDPTRVYAIGISAGAFEASILGTFYPDVFAAIGVHSGAAYMGGEPACFNNQDTAASDTNTDKLAQAAVAAMGSRARVVPVFVIHGDADDTIPYACGPQAVAQWLSADNLSLKHVGLPAISTSPTHARNGTIAGGHAFTVLTYDDASGCTVAQMWTVHGMAHIWSGGTSAPSSARYSDPKGPSAAEASWAFFSRWRLSGPLQPCTEPPHEP